MSTSAPIRTALQGLVVLGAMALATAPPPCYAAVCPQSEFAFMAQSRVVVPSSLAVRETTVTEYGPEGFAGEYHAAYDLTEGVVRVSCDRRVQGWVEAIARDEFIVQGPVSSPFTLRVNLRVVGESMEISYGGYATIFATLIHGTTTRTAARYNGPLKETLVLDIMVTAGVPFALQYATTAGGQSGEGHVDATLDFVGLPPGAVLASCQGYRRGVTATRSSSWGAVRVRYR